MLVYVLVLILLTAPLSLFLHECGHVLPALGLRAEQSQISIGSGKRLFSLSFRRVKIHIHTIFFHGAHSLNERSIQFTKKEKAWISVGGPLLNGAISWVGFMVLNDHVSYHLSLFVWFNAYLAVVNSIPFRIKGRESDGYRFLQSFFS
ncbi:site-2 protease family protein [Halobacillus salinus]|uniref:site-2 protease family protein n=1 Tax=Halobacillus salinus TaxID=192814 RepID=UPI0009A83E10|nr:site-2 protease family protein [Halobacillus salinus]